MLRPRTRRGAGTRRPPPVSAVGVALLAAGALGPALPAVGPPAGPVFHAGAGLAAVAIPGFAAAYVRLYASSDRRRVGFHGVLAGVADRPDRRGSNRDVPSASHAYAPDT